MARQTAPRKIQLETVITMTILRTTRPRQTASQSLARQNPRLSIALHSRYALLKTELRMCPPEKS